MSKKYQAPRGTHDVLPVDSPVWRFVEQTFADHVSLFGYEEIRTPMFEDVELFVRSSGETSDIVSKEMYDFVDKGGRHIALKPEETAPSVRAYVEHSLGQPGQVTRLRYCTPIFRYERPQKGRFRQAHQVGLELIGSPSPAADAEVIEITVGFYQKLGLKNISVVLNCIGRGEARQNYCNAVLAHVDSWLQSQDEDGRAKAHKNPLRLLDTKDPDLRAVLEGVPTIADFLSDESKSHFDEVKRHLDLAGVAFEYRPSLVRGLDYYTDTVFEVQTDALGAQNALCGGGRYDWLVRELGGADTPSVGVAMGIERAIMVMKEQGVELPVVPAPLFLVAATEGANAEVAGLARELRRAGIAILTDLDGKGLKQQMKQADRAGSRLALIIGDEEISNGTVTIKDLQAGSQRGVERAVLLEELRV
jgi:histidyl-tRNA synthetase